MFANFVHNTRQKFVSKQAYIGNKFINQKTAGLAAGIGLGYYCHTQLLHPNRSNVLQTVNAHQFGLTPQIGDWTLLLPPPTPVLEDISHGGLTPLEFRPFRLTDINVLSPDTCIYYFNLSSANAPLNLPVCSYVLARAEINDEKVIRPYTPLANFTGELPILVKTYPRSKLGSKFASMEVGDTMHFKGPFQTFEYKKNEYDRVTLICGGTGIAPMFQIIDRILSDPSDRTKIHLITCNKTELDILLGIEIDEFKEAYPNRFKVTAFVEKPTSTWKGLTGYVNKEVLMAVLGKPHPHSKVFVSFPPPGMEHVCGAKGENYTQGKMGGLLAELGYTERDVWKF